jgi:hypothetical protein
MGYTSPCLCRGILITTDPLCLSGHVSSRDRGHPWDTLAPVCAGVFSLQQILSASLVMYPVELEATHGIHQPLFVQGYSHYNRSSLLLWSCIL